MHGETLPPQENVDAPWVDEVQQSVAVPAHLNTNNNCFVHQAGAYQRDNLAGGVNYMAVPFFSASLARHCKGNSCLFASWGTQAHVPTIFTSPIMVSWCSVKSDCYVFCSLFSNGLSVQYINKYTNCGNGIVEHTQMIHKWVYRLWWWTFFITNHANQD